MYTTFFFDVEDYITPPEGGMDDLLKMLADVMSEERVSGTFFIIGEKLRCLRDRGRRDVIDSLTRHDIGSHINMGSIHPTVTERLEHADWTDGCARMAADELAGIEELEEITGKPVSSLSRHGGSFGTQLVAVLGSRKLPYMHSPAQVPEHNITWYCNTLNVFSCIGSFEVAYHSRAGLQDAEQQFLALTREHDGWDWVGLFNSHPCHIKARQFPCMNYYKGCNPLPEDWVVPEFHPEFSLEEVRSNWQAHCQHVREDADLDLKTFEELRDIFGRQADVADEPEVRDLAQRAADADAPFFTDRFSAAEILDFLARAYVHRHRTGNLPATIERRDVMGPSQLPLGAPTAKSLHPEAVIRLARGIMTAVDVTGCLPSVVRCGEGTLGSHGEVGAGSALVALGRALSNHDAGTTIQTCPVNPYPAKGNEIADNVRQYRRWNPHRLDLDLSSACRLAALQSWTLKPAWEGSPPAADA